MKTVFITGAYGFLGRHTAAYFKARGCRVIGMGHGCWEEGEAADYGIDLWIQGNICIEKLTTIEEPLNCIIHCAGSSSVGHSFQDPRLDFEKTVSSTVQILDYIRTKNPDSKLLYPSSGAVYGAQPDRPINEHTRGQPASPYGIHKNTVENLCNDYSNLYGISISVVRFFSLYGPCLRKQLLWDACEKIHRADKAVTFFGTGNETRDWLHVMDAAALLYCLFESKSSFEIYNGGSGTRHSVREILMKLRDCLESDQEILFGNEHKQGDPKHFWADTTKISKLGWVPRKSIDSGIEEYVSWYQAIGEDKYGIGERTD